MYKIDGPVNYLIPAVADLANQNVMDIEEMDVEAAPELLSDVIPVIFSNAELPSWRPVSCVSKAWNMAARDMKVKTFDAVAFGLDQWVKHMNAPSPSDEEIQESLSMLPYDIEDILNSPCQVFPESGKLVKDTHVLVYIPKSVNGTEITFTSLEKLAKTKLKDGKPLFMGYDSIPDEVLKEWNKPVEEAHWVLMTKNVLGGMDTSATGSRGKFYAKQAEMVKELAGNPQKVYVVPKALEAVAVAIAHLLKSGEYIFGQGSPFWTYTICEEVLEVTTFVHSEATQFHVVVGGFAQGGLDVDNCRHYYHDSIGVAGLRRFSLGSRSLAS